MQSTQKMKKKNIIKELLTLFFFALIANNKCEYQAFLLISTDEKWCQLYEVSEQNEL